MNSPAIRHPFSTNVCFLRPREWLMTLLWLCWFGLALWGATILLFLRRLAPSVRAEMVRPFPDQPRLWVFGRAVLGARLLFARDGPRVV
jgi:hypothetical protein